MTFENGGKINAALKTMHSATFHRVSTWPLGQLSTIFHRQHTSLEADFSQVKDE